ncbi:TIGR04540 family protein [Neobacillus vireti]|uniref:TIGR04540 family protein n=1 Tax=Neobacillus vireti TaxID=220686 RepID=UPI002FFF0C9D
MKLFYKTQRELANSLNEILDAYWESKINEEVLIKNVSDIYLNNSKKLLKGNDFTTVLKQQCGKRRLEVVAQILTMNKLIGK